jgi:DNA-binding IclR family transcriptional regulator
MHQDSPELKTRSVPALDRALTALELLASTKSGLTLPELSRRLDLPKSSMHSLLLTLERRGYLHRNPKTNRYLFGLQLFTLANMALSGIELREKAAPFLRVLMGRTRLTVHLVMLDRNEAVLIDKVEPPNVYKLATWVGKRMDLHCTAVGKALLAHYTEAELDEMVKSRGLPRHNDNTICSPRKLKEDLARARRLGYSVEDEEDEIGYRCIGAAILDSGGKAIGAVSVSGDTGQISADNLAPIAEQVKQCAASVSSLLGYHSPL